MRVDEGANSRIVRAWKLILAETVGLQRLQTLRERYSSLVEVADGIHVLCAWERVVSDGSQREEGELTGDQWMPKKSPLLM